MTGMRCAACGYEQFGAFPSASVECKPDEKYEKHAVECENIPIPYYGENVVSLNKRTTFYVCPNCGTLRIRIKGLKKED